MCTISVTTATGLVLPEVWDLSCKQEHTWAELPPHIQEWLSDENDDLATWLD